MGPRRFNSFTICAGSTLVIFAILIIICITLLSQVPNVIVAVLPDIGSDFFSLQAIETIISERFVNIL